MDPVTLIVTALAAGAIAGLSKSTTETARDATAAVYSKLRTTITARFAGNPTAQVFLAEHAQDPVTYQAPLAKQLTATRTAEDRRVIELATELMTLLDGDGARTGKYTVDLRGAQGVQVGDQNTMHYRPR